MFEIGSNANFEVTSSSKAFGIGIGIDRPSILKQSIIQLVNISLTPCSSIALSYLNLKRLASSIHTRNNNNNNNNKKFALPIGSNGEVKEFKTNPSKLSTTFFPCHWSREAKKSIQCKKKQKQTK